MPTHGHTPSPVIAAVGVNLVFDDPRAKEPATFRPAAVECRNCHTLYLSSDNAGVAARAVVKIMEKIESNIGHGNA